MQRDFDAERESEEIAALLGSSIADVRRAYIGDGEGNINAVDDTDYVNAYYIRLDRPDNPEFTVAFADPFQQTQLFTTDAIVKVKPYYQDGIKRVGTWVIIGGDELMTNQQFGFEPPDPSSGIGNIVQHNHTSPSTGGTLDINTLTGILAAARGGTGIDMVTDIGDDKAVLVFNTATEQVEAANWQFGGLIAGADTAAPMVINATAEGDIVEAYDTGSAFAFRRKANNFTASTNPSNNDDEGDGYYRGSLWYNTSTEVLYWCKSNATGSAVWVVATLGTPRSGVDTIDPTVDDDIDLGYGVGSLWVNTTTPALFICYDASDGAADWQPVGNTYTPPLDNLGASADPTISDDETMGYGVRSLWENTSNNTTWICINPATGAAVWKRINASGSPVTITTNYSVVGYDRFLLIDATAGNITVTLPAVSVFFELSLTIKRIDATGNTVTIDGDGANIDGAGTYTLTTQYESITMTPDNTQWWAY